MDSLTTTLALICGADNIQTGATIGEEYRRDFLAEYYGKARAVVFPQNEEQVAKVVRVCYEANAPVVARGGNTGYAAAAVPDNSGKAVLMFGILPCGLLFVVFAGVVAADGVVAD